MGKKFYLFSEVEGTVTEAGKPIAGAEIERIHEWKNKPRSERVTTGADGRFTFPEVTETSFLTSILPQEPIVPQKIIIRVRGVEYKGWMYTKHDYEPRSELGGKPIRLDCDIRRKADYQDSWFGICTLSGE